MAEPPTGEQPAQPSLLNQQPDELPPVKRDNGVAVVGFTLAVIVPPLGLIVSIIGLTKSKALGGAGKTLSVAGIVVSLLVGAGIGTLVAIAGPAAPDPGCITAQVTSQDRNTISADEAAMSRDQNSPLAVRADVRHFVVYLRSLETRFTTAEAQARNQSVKAALSTLASDLKTVTSGVQGMLNDDAMQAIHAYIQALIAGDELESDGNALQSACNAVDGPGLVVRSDGRRRR